MRPVILPLLCAVFALGSASTADAQDLGLRLVSSSYRQIDGGARLLAVPGGVHIDFGNVTTRGGPPDNGRRVEVKNGAYYLATVELEVVRLDPLVPRAHGRFRRGLPGHVSGGKSHMLPLGDGLPEQVDIYAHVVQDAMSQGGEVVLAVDHAADWHTEQGMVELGATDTPIAWALGPGDRVRCEIGLFASSSTAGPQLAQVRFEAH